MHGEGGTVDDTFLIDGRRVRPSSSRTTDLVSPSTEQRIGRVPEAAEDDVDAAVGAAYRALRAPGGWSRWPVEERAAALERLADALAVRGEEIARRVAVASGMPITTARRYEAADPPMILRSTASTLRAAVSEEFRDGARGGRVRVTRSPVGVVAVVAPPDFPVTAAVSALGPALAAGCPVVLRPDPTDAPAAALLADAVDAAGLPPGVVDIVPGGRDTGAYLVEHPVVDHVVFTGPTATGRRVAEACGRLLRPATLTLGGTSAAIVLDDADLAAHLDALYAATLLHNGQARFLGTRILAPSARYGEIVDVLTDWARDLPVGDPLDPATRIGPLASARRRERVEAYLAKGRHEGARTTTGGARPAGRDRGWYLEPTVFAEVDNGATIAQEEIPGPVLSVIRYRDVDEAVALANDSDHGLAGTVWTADPERGATVAARIETATVGVNGYRVDPAGPVGARKDSGVGSSLGPEGLAAFRALSSTYLPW